uniref:VWFA domain-containing protein n=1 Tax=Macrostomum lignano TaxID=282301 RepID=A0A1I8FKX5_9PLAT
TSRALDQLFPSFTICTLRNFRRDRGRVASRASEPAACCLLLLSLLSPAFWTLDRAGRNRLDRTPDRLTPTEQRGTSGSERRRGTSKLPAARSAATAAAPPPSSQERRCFTDAEAQPRCQLLGAHLQLTKTPPHPPTFARQRRRRPQLAPLLRRRLLLPIIRVDTTTPGRPEFTNLLLGGFGLVMLTNNDQLESRTETAGECQSACAAVVLPIRHFTPSESCIERLSRATARVKEGDGEAQPFPVLPGPLASAMIPAFQCKMNANAPPHLCVSQPQVTNDPEEFQEMIEDIFVQGGGDCPEATLQGIKLALEAAQRASFIYVFTDASAKRSANCLTQFLNSFNGKRVVFVLTGDCGDENSAAFQCYQRISQASSGILIRIMKNRVLDLFSKKL